MKTRSGEGIEFPEPSLCAGTIFPCLDKASMLQKEQQLRTQAEFRWDLGKPRLTLLICKMGRMVLCRLVLRKRDNRQKEPETARTQ